MMQQEQPDDFVIATGKQFSVKAFVEAAAAELGIRLRWEGSGVDETGIVDSISGELEPPTLTPHPGQVIVRVDPRYFRPTEVETLLGDASKAHRLLGWSPKISFEELVTEMVREDLQIAQRDQLCVTEGFKVFRRHE